MKWIALSLIAAPMMVGCGGRSNVGAPSVLAKNAPHVTEGALDGSPLLADVAEQAKKLGAGTLSTVFSQELGSGERGGAFVAIPKDVCLLAFARASSSVDDIDLAAFADDGNPVSIDEAPDARPTVVVCPPHPDRVYVAVHVAEGEGLIAVGAQYVTKEKGLILARALGARGALGGAVRRPEAWPGLDSALKNRREALQGSWEEQRRVALSVDSSAPAYVAIAADADSCIDFLVLGDDDVSDLDVELIDRTGRIVGRSRNTSPARGIVMCTKEPFQGNAKVRPHAGRGLAAVVVQRAKFDVMGGFGKDVDVILFGEGKPLLDLRKALDASLLSLSYGAPTKAVDLTTIAGRRSSTTIQLPVWDGCYRVDTLAGAVAPSFEFTTRFENGRVAARGVAFNHATTFFCGGGNLVSEIDARARNGKITILVRKEPWTDSQFAKFPIAAGRMLRRALGEAPHGYEKASKVDHVTLEAGKRTTWETVVPAGKCSRIAIGVEGAGTGFEMRLFESATDEELDRAHGVESEAVRACAKSEPRTLKLEATATSGKLDAVLGERTHDN